MCTTAATAGGGGGGGGVPPPPDREVRGQQVKRIKFIDKSRWCAVRRLRSLCSWVGVVGPSRCRAWRVAGRPGEVAGASRTRIGRLWSVRNPPSPLGPKAGLGVGRRSRPRVMACEGGKHTGGKTSLPRPQNPPRSPTPWATRTISPPFSLLPRLDPRHRHDLPLWPEHS